MAIKISGTTVIDNSRNLTNVGGLKTINSNSILGSGDISISSGSTVSGVAYSGYSPTYPTQSGAYEWNAIQYHSSATDLLCTYQVVIGNTSSPDTTNLGTTLRARRAYRTVS
jgi:hypothetical protein